ncbi:membrane-bound alpha-1,6- mannosyltransferase Initiation-specific [Chytridiales sp. JEL 0842]|nr:membrane-bound alpha-1,6- mannosyltransferase Initiation-specific [Chytridiales sp. JEL 0842]
MCSCRTLATFIAISFGISLLFISAPFFLMFTTLFQFKNLLSFISPTQEPPPLILQSWITADLSYASTHASSDVNAPYYPEWVSTWKRQNPGHLHLILPDDDAELMVQKRFAGSPVARAFERLPKESGKRREMLKYLIVLEFGGVYADMDTWCVKPVEEWVPEWASGVRFIAGLEWDEAPTLNVESRRLVTHTFLSSPKHPILNTLVEQMTSRILSTPLSRLRNPEFSLYEAISSPTLTEVVEAHLQSFSRTLDEAAGLKNGSVQLGDVLLLGVTSFNAYHSDSAGVDHSDVYVVHAGSGAWTTGGWKEKLLTLDGGGFGFKPTSKGRKKKEWKKEDL